MIALYTYSVVYTQYYTRESGTYIYLLYIRSYDIITIVKSHILYNNYTYLRHNIVGVWYMYILTYCYNNSDDRPSITEYINQHSAADNTAKSSHRCITRISHMALKISKSIT